MPLVSAEKQSMKNMTLCFEKHGKPTVCMMGNFFQTVECHASVGISLTRWKRSSGAVIGRYFQIKSGHRCFSRSSVFYISIRELFCERLLDFTWRGTRCKTQKVVGYWGQIIWWVVGPFLIWSLPKANDRHAQRVMPWNKVNYLLKKSSIEKDGEFRRFQYVKTCAQHM